MPGWREALFEGVMIFRNGKSIKPSDEGKYPVFGANGIIGYCDHPLYDHGVILGRVGAYCGAVAFSSGPFWATDNTIVVQEKPDISDIRFLQYFLTWSDLNRHAGGAAQPLLTQGRLKALEAFLPPLDEQKRIADILSAYDDLIEVNQRRIAILEEMARRLFDEWFIRFCFPGHETVEMVETELGPVPEGWRLGTVVEISEYIGRGIAPKYDEAADGLVINQKCIRDQALAIEPARRQSKPIPPVKVIVYGDVLVNSTGVGTLGRVAQVLANFQNTTVDTHVTIVRASQSVNLHYFGAQLLQLQSHFERQGIGATGQTELSRTAISETSIVIPPEGLRERFGEIAGPMRQQAELLRAQNTRLRAARDLLLPKLISGEIDVGKAEEVFAEAAE